MLSVQKILAKYKNLKEELEVAYTHGLNYSIINELHYDMNNLKKALLKLNINLEKELGR